MATLIVTPSLASGAETAPFTDKFQVTTAALAVTMA